MRVFFYAILVQVVFNTYVFWRGWQLLPKKKAVRIPFLLLFAIQLIVYLSGYIGATNLPHRYLFVVGGVGTTWTIFILYTTVLLFIYDILRFINKRFGILSRINFRSIKLRSIYYISVCLLVIAVMIGGGYRFRHPVVTEMTLYVEKKTPNIKELKIVMVSDIHAGSLINKQILNKYVNHIMAQNPDIILIPGDIIDYDLKSVKKQQLEEEFKRLKAPYGVYASTGNHDYIKIKKEEPEAKIKWLEQSSGMTLLRDTMVLIDNSFYIIGREDDKYENRKQLVDIIEGIDKSLPMIVLNHEPRRLSEEADAGIDIALYGHTHNGQIFPYNILVYLLYEVGYGYKKKDNTHIYVSSGLGLAGPQYRIGTKSEIVVLNVKFGKE